MENKKCSKPPISIYIYICICTITNRSVLSSFNISHVSYVTPSGNQTWLAAWLEYPLRMEVSSEENRKIAFFNGPFSSTPCLMKPEGNGYELISWFFMEIMVHKCEYVMSSFYISYALVICYIAIENGHRNSGFPH